MPVLLVVSLGAPGPAVAVGDCGAQPAPCVVVRVVAGTSETARQVFPASALTGLKDVDGGTSYVVRTSNGPSTVSVPPAASLRSLVAQVVGIAQVRFVDVVGDDGLRHQLGPDELGPPGSSGFPSALAPAFYPNDPTDPANLFYVRPPRDGQDLNGAPGVDLGYFSTNGAIVVTAHTTGSVLTVDPTATAGTADRSFSFAATVSGDHPQLGWSWAFGDGSAPDKRPTPSHTYGADGTYAVLVAVEDQADGSFGYGSTQAVGAAPPDQTPTAGPSGTGTNPNPSAPANGPNASGGDQPGGKPSKKPTSTPTTAPPAVPTPAPTSDPAEPTAGAPLPSLAPPPGPLAPSDAPSADPPPVAVDVQDGEVTGILLSSAALSAPAPSAEDEFVAPSARALSSDDSPIDPLVWWSFVVPLLLVVGAAAETGVPATVRRMLRTGTQSRKMSP